MKGHPQTEGPRWPKGVWVRGGHARLCMHGRSHLQCKLLIKPIIIPLLFDTLYFKVKHF